MRNLHTNTSNQSTRSKITHYTNQTIPKPQRTTSDKPGKHPNNKYGTKIINHLECKSNFSQYHFKPIGEFEISIHSTAPWNKNNILSKSQYSMATDPHLEDYSNYNKTN